MSFSSTLLRTVALAGALTFSGAALAQDAAAQETITIAASPVPHAEILNFIKPELAKQGVNLVVRELLELFPSLRILADGIVHVTPLLAIDIPPIALRVPVGF